MISISTVYFKLAEGPALPVEKNVEKKSNQNKKKAENRNSICLAYVTPRLPTKYFSPFGQAV